MISGKKMLLSMLMKIKRRGKNIKNEEKGKISRMTMVKKKPNSMLLFYASISVSKKLTSRNLLFKQKNI